MGLFSFFRKNKQEAASGQGEFRSRSAGDAPAAATRSKRKAGKEESADPVLPEKKRARRRLIGAVALVLAVVILLPMVLDSEPRPLADDIAIQIPSKEPAATAAPAATAPDAKVATGAGLDQKEEIVAPANVPVTPPVVAQAVPAAPAVKPAENPVEKAPEKIAEKPVEKPADKPEHEKPKAAKPVKPEPERKPVVKTEDSDARALAILEGKPAADKKPAASGGKFVIQVAALATQEKIDELRNKLSGAGIKTYTQKVATQSGDRTRIRVGPFGSRDEAEKMRGRINKLGLSATIVPA
ncbi:SPOR domain-containing protein [Herbaspirillum autotrophicum]|uniref:SPOR domain-containing protein n=1 Tax=Herbaspirillum autotrophicum TaxID=180195 RepID=UPI00067B52D2|nr:SPOR domain-containing protein [Herbaspirillum autotrophicum]